MFPFLRSGVVGQGGPADGEGRVARTEKSGRDGPPAKTGSVRATYRLLRGEIHMNSITAFLVFALMVAGVTLGYRENLYVGIAFIAIALIVATSLKMANV